MEINQLIEAARKAVFTKKDISEIQKRLAESSKIFEEREILSRPSQEFLDRIYDL